MIEQVFMRGDGLDALRIVLGLASLAAAIAYQVVERQPPSTLRTALKTLAIGLLVPLPLLLLGAPGVAALPLVLLALAFLLSSLGDLFLALKGDTRNFMRGLVAFLVSHLFYISVMLPLASSPETLPAKAASLFVGLGAIALYLSLAPALGRMKLPFGAYLVAILVMALSALAIPAGQPWLGLGAVLFVISDSVIALDKFRGPIPYRGLIVWSTYYVGQAMMALSLLALLG
ncbi:lysoplasmalogenase [Parvibaculum sp.]|uniref:lysoplasmalogenase n=1 Tax=Parvibaculum sp. TaxID=2024848 RepID=UPI00272F3356|nr:lysoplasmalogenase [Parvibaculum sp.]MDP1626550.1 lysoplasmalogenase [Parvibaculum sp.]MDP2150472.1 lysoplasmalogenase [Parvibaculum sp.]MDP3327692.1 lysoplasmalogenase [Parvibaculum sp.]